ncbi:MULTISPECIES: hypothetical protein [Sinorhizobium]|uniref:hypothetical protein n=1 Tax=Sinorhizobium TaxID=28105 RepID=UPI000BE7B7C7|nr:MULTISPECIES: hypothetical protein [Sinorhizobium]PDT50834.1 hypothetical protein CO664_23985 [Sinorhizobium sp. NG07B]POH24954.1 hypothetical protein ATY30_28300 [Sinorhizobium americanum]
MSPTTDFIVELIRAAKTGIRGSNRAKDVLIDLHQASAKSDRLAPNEIRDALIDAADVIRTLKIALDGKE